MWKYSTSEEKELATRNLLNVAWNCDLLFLHYRIADGKLLKIFIPE
jgi:hypothetical protein